MKFINLEIYTRKGHTLIRVFSDTRYFANNMVTLKLSKFCSLFKETRYIIVQIPHIIVSKYTNAKVHLKNSLCMKTVASAKHF